MLKSKFLFLGIILISSFSLTYAQETSREYLGMNQTTDYSQLMPAEEAAPVNEQPVLPASSGNVVINSSVTSSSQNKISLDVKGMDVVDVLKMLSNRAGLNLCIGKNVTGRVTLFLKDVDIRDAFEIVLLANDLAYEQKGDIMNVMTQRDYELLYGQRFEDAKKVMVVQLKFAKAANISLALNQIKTNIGRVVTDEASNSVVLIDTPDKIKEMKSFIDTVDVPLVTRVFGLNYAQAEKLSAKLQEAITKGVGSIKIDERTNKIVVTDYPAKLDEIATIIDAFDEKTPQVLIDAQLIQVNPTDKFEMGVNWDYWLKKFFEVKAALPINSGNTLFLGTPTGNNVTNPGDYKAVMDILRTIGDTKVLSSPRIMVLNNQEAKIHVGSRDAYITSTTSQSGSGTSVTSQTVNFVDVGIQLYVTPTINRDGYVTMKIKPEISDSTRTDITSEGQITQIPIVSTSEAETTVLVKDGVTLIIGGLRKDKREKTVKKIPILGDIPFCGYLFRSTTDNKTQGELVILLTPHIVGGETSYIDFSEMPPKSGARAEMTGGTIVTQKTSQAAFDKIEAYHKSIADKLSALTSFGKANQKGSAEVYFTLDPTGKLRGEPKVTSATDERLIPQAISCIKKAQPFSSFPEGMTSAEENFHLTMVFK